MIIAMANKNNYVFLRFFSYKKGNAFYNHNSCIIADNNFREGRIMIEQDTIKLLRECDAGIKMGVSAIDEVLEYVKSDELKMYLNENKDEHNNLDKKLQELLHKYKDDGKEPNPVAKGMSWMKTNMKLSMNESDNTIADLITDGCNMGVKSLSKYLNKYAAADEQSKNICKKLIKLEEELAVQMRDYL